MLQARSNLVPVIITPTSEPKQVDEKYIYKEFSWRGHSYTLGHYLAVE